MYVNGKGLLSSQWNISIEQEIEYDFDVDGNKGEYSIRYKGTIESFSRHTNIILIKTEHGECKQYELNQINIWIWR